MKTLKLVCEYCNKKFERKEKIIKMYEKRKRKHTFCSPQCNGKYRITKQKIKCKRCNKQFFKDPSQIKKTKNHFCSSSCAGIYNIAHRKTGTRRSKLEIWVEKQLSNKYNFKILFNDKTAINSELDIYIPFLELAFELNGIFHYEPIFGIEKLSSIKNNDNRKFQACLEQNIELCILDVSQQKYFKEKSSKKYLDIIIYIIENKLSVQKL